MHINRLIAKHFKELIFGPNWIAVTDLKTVLSDVTWEEAIHRIGDLNTIAVLVYHVYYYVKLVNRVLEGGPLEGHDSLSFDTPPIGNSSDWNDLLNNVWINAEKFIHLVEGLPKDKMMQDFAGGEYGSYYRNLQAIVEHHHYHLGQIVLIKKLVRNPN